MSHTTSSLGTYACPLMFLYNLQYDQMAKSMVQYFAVCSNENLPNGKVSLKYCQIHKNDPML